MNSSDAPLGLNVVLWQQRHDDVIFSGFAHSCHLIRAIVGYAAMLSTCGYVLLFASHANLRTKLNWTVCNLVVSNGLLALVIAIFSTLKAVNAECLHRLGSCLSFTWVIVFLSFSPSWSVGLMASIRAVQFAKSTRPDSLLSLRCLLFIRLLIVVMDSIVTSLVLYDKSGLVASTHCTYQLMLETSAVYMIYTLLIILFLVTAALTAFVLRLRRRRQILAQISSDLNNGTNGDRKLTYDRPVPANLFKKPFLLLLGCLLVFLFTLPRIAFLIDNYQLWQLSTLCPVIIAFILPPSFVYYTKDCRMAAIDDVLSIFYTNQADL